MPAVKVRQLERHQIPETGFARTSALLDAGGLKPMYEVIRVIGIFRDPGGEFRQRQELADLCQQQLVGVQSSLP